MGCSSVSVRGLAAIAAVCALACVAAASASAAPLAVVGNSADDEVSVVDTATMRVVGEPIEAGDGPASIAITPDGRYAYIADAFGNTVSVIDTATREPVGAPIPVGQFPFGLAITPDGSRAFVTDSSGGEVSAVDTRTRQVVGIPLENDPTGIAISPSGELAYVTEAAAGVVEVIDTKTMEVVGEAIEVGDGPVGIEFTPDGATAYVVDRGSDEVSAIDTATREVTPIELEGEGPRGIVVAPDGSKAFVAELASHSVAVLDTATDEEIEEIDLAGEPGEVASSANGRTVYVTVTRGIPGEAAEVERISVATGTVVGPPIELSGEFASGIALTPDQSPTAAFTAPSAIVGSPATFSGDASTDPDGSIAAWSWAFGDGGTATGASAAHTYAAPGTYAAKLSVVDDEGCGEEEVFTGRTAYCSGGESTVTHPITARLAPPRAVPSPLPPAPSATPSNEFRFGRVIHNRRNGTVRLQVRLPSAGFVFLFGRKVHAVKRKSKGVQRMWLTLHARVELNKRLKKIHRARVRFRVTFTPDGGTARTVHRSAALLRAPGPRHRRHDEHRRS